MKPTLKKTEKYEIQYGLFRALLSLTPAYWNPAWIERFLTQTKLENLVKCTSERFLGQGLFLFLRQLDQHQNQIPKPIRRFYEEWQQQTELRNLMLADEAANLIRAFEAAQIPVLVTKGIAYYVAIHSEYFRERLIADIDLLTPQNFIQQAGKQLEENGFTQFETADYSVTFMKQLAETPIFVDLHWFLPSLPSQDRKSVV